jgi:preprotein translocase subunit SecG
VRTSNETIIRWMWVLVGVFLLTAIILILTSI